MSKSLLWILFYTALLGLSHVVQAATINCSSFWAKYNISSPCEEVIPQGSPTSIDGKAYRFFHYSNSSWTGSSAELDLLNRSAKAVRDSVSLYSKYGKVPSIYFYLSDHGDPGDTAAFTAYASAKPGDAVGSEPCPVQVYPAAVAIGHELYDQVLAHEIFHCFQGENFKPQLNGQLGIDHDAWNRISAWWVEGSAHYFSNLVYPSVNWEWQTSPFYKGSEQLHLQGNPYATAAFFQSMGN